MIVFVADAFVEQYGGGAELTTDALLKTSLLPVKKILSHELTLRDLEHYKGCFWIFGNFAAVREEYLLYAIKNLAYSVLEYDYKYCKYRSPEKHIEAEGACNCHNTRVGKIRSVFIAKSRINWWMSESQRDLQRKVFPFMSGQVLSSVFSSDTLNYIETLETNNKKDNWIILNSSSWIKGVGDAVKYAKQNNLQYELVGGLNYKEFLMKLASSKGLIFLPPGGDTCPRMVIEAKLLGCELILNNNVQHKDEAWFETRESCFEYLRTRTSVFWDRIEKEISFLPTTTSSKGPKYHIVSPFYNAEPYLTRCISSLKRQKYSYFSCTLIDDMSTDNSYDVAKRAISGDNRFKLVKNLEKCYALKNINDAVDCLDAKGEDVVILLDGDDWFASSQVLGHLNTHYQDDDCWMTYGSYIIHPNGYLGPEPTPYPREVIDKNMYRKDTWRASHLRTFRKEIWDKICKEDLKDLNKNFYKMAYDQAIMLPLIEMSGDKCKYVENILHVYNKENPLNVDKIKAKEQSRTAQQIRNKTPYERL